ncbi:MAG: radical SAM protein [Nitrospiraceae bacterium]|nr:radical SAM protein [Nitrospiraceae bacterium]
MKLYKKARLLFTWTFTGTKTTAAIDITNTCNLKCSHCYWWKEERPAELDDDEMVAFMKGLRKKGMTAAIIYGGEPMLRPLMCEAASRIFDHPLIFTNGTQGFSAIDAQWILSLDGTRDIHDSIRGSGAYDCSVANLRKAPRRPVVHMTITRQNRHNLEEFLEELSGLPIKGVGFSFYTPHISEDRSSLALTLDERDLILDELLGLRKKYWRIMGLTPKMADQFRQGGEFSAWNSIERCPVSRVCNCYNSDGTPKPCTYGNNADCSRCGCTSIAVYRAAIHHLDPLALFMIYRMVN